jgi:hypothetical protein
MSTEGGEFQIHPAAFRRIRVERRQAGSEGGDPANRRIAEFEG